MNMEALKMDDLQRAYWDLLRVKQQVESQINNLLDQMLDRIKDPDNAFASSLSSLN